ncbi:urease accessory protein UreD [Spongiactinospora rosea]|uniref:urease accessory protein UreD n=1 Tax=Spongiactinospora rosea TaxID=2248750 RepID=UPI0011C04ED1|nr:urease accessory protein UreD [Spongiactinospora rosea]
MGRTGIHARARLTVRRGKRGLTVPTEMFGEPPYHLLRAGRADAVPLHIFMTGSCAGPLGGDRYTVEVDVGAGAALEVGSAAAAVALPSSDRRPSHTATTIRIATGGRLIWSPQPTIHGGGSRHHTATTIELDAGAGLIYRETQALGLHGVPPAEARSHIKVTFDGGPLWEQHTALGSDVHGGTGPAVTGRARVLQQTLIVHPDMWCPGGTHRIPAQALAPGSCLLPLAGGPALLISVLADHHDQATRISATGLAAAGLTTAPGRPVT